MAGPLSFLLLFCCIYFGAPEADGAVTFSNNGYDDVLIALSPDIPESLGLQLIAGIKRLFIKSNSVLFTAMRKRAYIRSVRILIPNSWTTVPVDEQVSWEKFQSAEFRIDRKSTQHQENPYALQTSGCGVAGQYIHLTPNFVLYQDLLVANTYGTAAKAIVNSWSRLRYGVFDEYGYPGDLLYPQFYYKWGIVMTPNACANENLLGDYRDTRTQGPCQYESSTALPNQYCRYVPYPTNTARTSLLSFTYLNAVDQFCDEEELYMHDTTAPNKQNVLCNYQSVWKVITSHSDFQTGRNPPNNGTVNLIPTFKVVQEPKTRFVLVMDTSASMSSGSNNQVRIVNLYQSATRWIQYSLPRGVKLGMVEFNTYSKVLSELQVVSGSTRADLIRRVPLSAKGETSIGRGLLSAVDVLTRDVERGGVIILMTDGENSPHLPGIADAWNSIVKNGIIVVTIAFGSQADTAIEGLAQVTGGKSYSVSDDNAVYGLNVAFQGALDYQNTETAEFKTVVIYEQSFRNTTAKLDVPLLVDKTIGRDFTVSMDYFRPTSFSNLAVIDPSGKVYTAADFTADPLRKTMILGVDEAEVGAWMLSVDLSLSGNDFAIIEVSSKSTRNETLPIEATCLITTGKLDDSAEVPIIMATVQQGYDSVLGATVQATITPPDATANVVTLDLLDNGQGADVMANDGVYSRYFLDYPSVGRYNVICRTIGTDTTFVNKEGSDTEASGHPTGAMAINGPRSGSVRPVYEETSTGFFSRHSNAGSYQAITTSSGLKLPPGRVTDLMVTNMVISDVPRDDESFTLTWTASGGSLDSRSALKIDIRYAQNQTDVLEHSFESATKLAGSEAIQPKDSGQVQAIKVSPAAIEGLKRGSHYFFALRVENSHGLVSKVSNTALLHWDFKQGLVGY